MMPEDETKEPVLERMSKKANLRTAMAHRLLALPGNAAYIIRQQAKLSQIAAR
jgi:hypothetical protein